jgi:hypothetical protein
LHLGPADGRGAIADRCPSVSPERASPVAIHHLLSGILRDECAFATVREDSEPRGDVDVQR